MLCLNRDYILNQTVHAKLTCMKKKLNVNGSSSKCIDEDISAIYLAYYTDEDMRLPGI